MRTPGGLSISRPMTDRISFPCDEIPQARLVVKRYAQARTHGLEFGNYVTRDNNEYPLTFDSVSLLVHALATHEFTIVDHAMAQELSVLPLAFGSVILERWDTLSHRASRFYLSRDNVTKFAGWLRENTPGFKPIELLSQVN